MSILYNDHIQSLPLAIWNTRKTYVSRAWNGVIYPLFDMDTNLHIKLNNFIYFNKNVLFLQILTVSCQNKINAFHRIKVQIVFSWVYQGKDIAEFSVNTGWLQLMLVTSHMTIEAGEACLQTNQSLARNNYKLYNTF